MSDWKYMCSFCEKNDKQVRRMWIHKTHRICNECAELVVNMDRDETEKAAQAAAAFELIGAALVNPATQTRGES